MIKIGLYLQSCPRVWQNYINAINPGGRLSDEEVDEITLKEWKGLYIANKNGRGGKVVFDTPADEIVFYLRWS